MAAGRADDGEVLRVDNPLAGRLRGWPRGMSGADLPENGVFRGLVEEALDRLVKDGTAATIRSPVRA